MQEINKKGNKITKIFTIIIIFLLGMILGILIDRTINNRECIDNQIIKNIL